MYEQESVRRDQRPKRSCSCSSSGAERVTSKEGLRTRLHLLSFAIGATCTSHISTHRHNAPFSGKSGWTRPMEDSERSVEARGDGKAWGLGVEQCP